MNTLRNLTHNRRTTLLILLGGAALVAPVAWAVYRSLTRVGWWWLGLSGYTDPAGVYHPPKQLWDFLELLIVPVALAIVAVWFDRAERKADRLRADRQADLDREMADRRAEVEWKRASDRQRENILQAYLDKMGELMLNQELLAHTNRLGDAVRNVAQIQTTTVLRILDSDRNNIVFQFLRDAGLADSLLVKASLEDMRLGGTNLRRINLSEANLWGSYLSEANLSKANLRGANLMRANLREARLRGANLSEARLRSADLSWTILVGANLCGANLNEANLIIADLSGANLSGADLSGADLMEADLTGANLNGASVDWDALSRVGSLAGAIMPDGQVYDPAVHGQLAEPA